MNGSFSLAPLFRHSVGFDRFDDLINTALRAEQGGGFPPYDIIREGENHYRIVMAVAGFTEQDISIVTQANELKVSGKVQADPAANEGKTWLHRGIARRAFERTFRLADHVEVIGAKLEAGLLGIELEQRIPEAARPRAVPINH